ncbi:MAG: metal ABC transporter permease [Tissierellia bacterium]|nr:metal ABC transporter permease [Tissierellia bacterium]
MISLFQYSYMIRAMIVGLCLSIIIPSIGIVVVNKRVSMIGDALSHVSLAGVMLGLILGINPILGAIGICLFASLGMEFINKRFPGYEEVSTAIIMSGGIGVASILSGFVKGSANIESFLFGSIVAITDFEWLMILIVSFLVFLFLSFLYKDLLYISFDSISADLSGVKVDQVNRLFMILTAITIAISARTVGVLIISSLMVLPVSCALRFGLGYFQTTLLSVGFGFLFTELGLVIAFYLGLKPGGTIVLLGVFTLVILLLFKKNQ